MTPMQQFALDILKERGEKGTNGAYVGARWQERNGRRAKAASRDSFGATSAGYRALRALVINGLATVRHTGEHGQLETYYIK